MEADRLSTFEARLAAIRERVKAAVDHDASSQDYQMIETDLPWALDNLEAAVGIIDRVTGCCDCASDETHAFLASLEKETPE